MKLKNTQYNSSEQSIHQNIPSKKEITSWLVSYFADLLGICTSEIDLSTPFHRYGIESSAAISMTGDLEEWLGYEFEPTIIYDYPTIKTLTQHITEELQSAF